MPAERGAPEFPADAAGRTFSGIHPSAEAVISLDYFVGYTCRESIPRRREGCYPDVSSKRRGDDVSLLFLTPQALFADALSGN